VLAVTDQHAAHTEGGGEGGEEEVDTVIEEISGLSSLHIKPRVVISDSKTKTSTAIQTTQIKEREPSSSSEGNGLIDRRRLCSVCASAHGCYTCPRCNATSCSLVCYKGHSTKCTEAFYKENVEEALKSQKADEEGQKKMMGVLTRLKQQEEEADEEHEAELYYRLAQLTTEDNLSLEQLSPEQREDFKRALVDGRISDMITLWQPWWQQPSSAMVQECANFENEERELKAESQKPPTILENIPPLSSLLKKEPSPFLTFNLVDILFSYAYIMRYFNGDPGSEAGDAISFLVEISAVFQSNAVHNSLDSALDSCFANILKPSVSGAPDFGWAVLEDVKLLVGQKSFTLMGLSDLHGLVSQAINDDAKSQKPAGRSAREAKEVRTKLVALQRKVFFFVVWVHEQDEALFRTTAALIEVIIRERGTGSPPRHQVNIPPRK